MKDLLLTILAIPLATTILLGVGALTGVSEKRQIRTLKVGALLSLLLVLVLSGLFGLRGWHPIQTQKFLVFKNGENEFYFSLFLDSVSLPFLLVTVFFENIVVFFSKRYMHREAGLRRFFLVISFLILGMHLAVLSSNLDLLFSGWEIVGISSYLLIAYYWEREKPVRNAERVYWIYRICDLGLLLGAFFAHRVWNEAVLFAEIGHALHIEKALSSISFFDQWFLGALILIAALGKSAQFPFLTWLPRALEGPTPSSAIFYGALSIHLGVYLLIRMEPVWHLIPGFAWVLGAIGIFSGILASSFGRLQATIKGQIAYASSAQVGMMFFEMALGFKTFALIHFTANALYRCYQLLAAPSIVAEQLQLQSSLGGVIYRSQIFIPRRFSESFYLFSLNEGYIDTVFQKLGLFISSLLSPIRLFLFSFRARTRFFVLLAWTGFLFLGFAGSYFLVLASLVCAYLAFEERKNPLLTLIYAFASQVFAILVAWVLSRNTTQELAICLATFGLGFVFACLSIYHVFRGLKSYDLNRYHGFFQTHPRSAALFFLSVMTMVGFPLSFTFLAEDIVFHDLVPHSQLCASLICITYVLTGGTMIRTFGAVFLGPQKKTDVVKDLDFPVWEAFCFLCLFFILQWLPSILGR